MDFWDLTKLLFRRWYIAFPLLVLTVVASLWTLASVKPNYLSRAYIQLIPPKSQPAQPGTPSVDQRNPWLSLGLNTLANAAMVTVQDLAVIRGVGERRLQRHLHGHHGFGESPGYV